MKRYTTSFLFLAVTLLAACYGAHRDHGESLADAGDVDGPLTCGMQTCNEVPAATCLAQDTLRTFSATCSNTGCSYPSTDTACGAAGCCGDHCCVLVPSNSDAVGVLDTTGLVIAPPSGTFNTDTGCVATSALGACSVVPRAGLPDACVCRMDELTIGSLKVTGNRALVIMAARSVDITTLLDVSADISTGGPGATRMYATTAAGSTGGAGGSYQTRGGGGGTGTASAATYGDPTLIPLLGGMRGQASITGGGGGGAVQITAGIRIGVTGKINAGGGGGQGGGNTWSSSGADGGGSGGAILLEAPSITITGGLLANGGGGGGGGGTGAWGGNGANAVMIGGSGGTGRGGAGCPLYGYVSGGYGGDGADRVSIAQSGGANAYDARCIGAAAFVGGGGGGGGVGRIRINTMTGCQCGGTVSPDATFGAVSVR